MSRPGGQALLHDPVATGRESVSLISTTKTICNPRILSSLSASWGGNGFGGVSSRGIHHQQATDLHISFSQPPGRSPRRGTRESTCTVAPRPPTSPVRALGRVGFFSALRSRALSSVINEIMTKIFLSRKCRVLAFLARDRGGVPMGTEAEGVVVVRVIFTRICLLRALSRRPA